MQIDNVHSREIPAAAADVGAVLAGLGSDDDRLWPSDRWPTLQFRLQGPLAAESPARHGPVRYMVDAYEPGRRLTFRFMPRLGLVGTHGFEIEPLDGRRTRLTHTLRARVEPRLVPLWPIVRGYHDALIEDVLAQADRSATGREVSRGRWPLWLRVATRAELWLTNRRRRRRSAGPGGRGGLRGLSKHSRRVRRMSTPNPPHRVVVVGGGFAGLAAVRGLRRAPVEVTLVDRRNFHLFQPLLYQAATGALTAAEIASPLRGLLKRQRNARVVLGDVGGFDLERRRVMLDGGARVDYDSLVVAAGARHDYFGHDEWRDAAPGLKTVEDAIEIRRRILSAFEAAELETDPARREAWLTFVVVGGGPTGVELAGQIAEIANDTLRRDFRTVDPRAARVLLVEAGDRLLGTFPERLSDRAARALGRLGVTPIVDRRVVGVSRDAVALRRDDGVMVRVPTRTVVWAAGVRAAGLAGALADAAGAGVDRAGRLVVGPDLTPGGRPEVLALGDMVRVHDADDRPLDLPGVAPAAMQQGRYAAKAIRARLKGREPGPFRYLDKGNVATIGRLKAVADIRGVPLSGSFAWLTWLFVHLFYLVGLQNRALVLMRWTVSFATRGRGARLITGEAPAPEPVPQIAWPRAA